MAVLEVKELTKKYGEGESNSRSTVTVLRHVPGSETRESLTDKMLCG